MFRRSRFSVRPNVGGVGRTPTPSQDAPSSSQESKEVAKDPGEDAVASVVTDIKPLDSSLVEATTLSEGNDPNGDATNSSAALQRRKRFSVKPRVAPGRPATLPRTPKSPAKVRFETPPKNSELKAKNELQASHSGVESLTSPQPEPVVVPCDDSGSEAAVSADPSPTESNKEAEKVASSDDPVLKIPPRPPDKVTALDKETAALSEKARTLLSSKSKKSHSIARYSLSRLLNDPSDIHRLEKAQKLRALLRQEMRKEKGAKKEKRKHVNEYSLESLDSSTMTMRDLIHYIPMSNPMSSSLEDGMQENENETEVPCSAEERSSQKSQKPEVAPTAPSAGESQLQEEGEQEQEEEEEVEPEEENDEALMVPRVKVAEDGTLILDEESLTVEVKRAKGPNPAEGRDPIFERGSTTTYSSFKASNYCKPWSSEETDMFFLAISMVGTDFTMIGQLFHNRTRAEIRNKFKREERQNSWRIDKAFRERRKLDIEYFTKLLRKILEVQANRKKLKSLSQKNATKKRQRRAKAADGSEAEDGEKENDEQGVEGKVKKTRKKCKRQSTEDSSSENLKKTKSEATEKSAEKDVACIVEDTDVTLPEDQPDSQVCESSKTDESSEHPSIQPAKLARGRAAKPLLPLGRKWSKKLPHPPTASKTQDDTPSEENDGVTQEALKEQVNKEASPVRVSSEEEGDDHDDNDVGDGDSSCDEELSAKPAKPTRYGRVPKPRTILEYPSKEEESAHKPPRKCTGKRARSSTAPSASSASKKSKLITLRASQSDFSEDEEESGLQQEDEAFVPNSLHSPSTVISQVEETIEELDILGNMSDVLDITQDGLCSDSFCEGEKYETGASEPCLHQLDLLADVIDLVSSEHDEVSEVESYNEAAKTLLAIGNISQSETVHDHGTETALESQQETSELLEEEIVAEFIKENSSIQIPFGSEDHIVAKTFETSTSLMASEDLSPQRDVSDPDFEAKSTDSQVVESSRYNETIFEAVDTESKHKESKAPLEHDCGDSDSNLQQLISLDEFPSSEENVEGAGHVTGDIKSTNADAAESCNDELASKGKAQESTTHLIQEDVEDETAPKVTPILSLKSNVIPSRELNSGEDNVVISSLATGATISTDAETAKSGINIETAEVKELFIEESTKALTQDGRDTDKALLECQKSSELIPSQQTKTSRFPKAKPKPNLRTSRNVQAKPQTTKEMSSTDKMTNEMEPQPTGTFCLQNLSQTTTSDLTVIPMLSIDLTDIPSEKLSEKKMLEVGLAAGDTLESGRNTKELSNTPATEPLDEESTTILDQEAGDHVSTLQELPGNLQKVVSRGRLPKIKPNLPQISTRSFSQSQPMKEISPPSAHESTSKTPTEVESQPTSSFPAQKRGQRICSSTAVPISSASSIVIPLTEQKLSGTGLAAQESKSIYSEAIESDCNADKPIDTAVSKLHDEEPTTILHEENENQDNGNQDSTLQRVTGDLRKVISRRSHFPKAKPNLPQISRSLLSNAQKTKEMCPSSDLESASKATTEVEPQPSCSFSMEKQGENMNSSTVVPILSASSDTELSAGITKITDCKTVQSSCSSEEPSDAIVKEPQAEDSNNALAIGDHDSNLQELPDNQRKVVSRRSRFPKVKPNLSQTARNPVPKSQTTKEMGPSSDLESTCKTKAEVEMQPTCSPSLSTESSVVLPIQNLNSSLTASDKNTCIEKKVDDQRPSDGDLEKKDPQTSKLSQETIQRRRRLPKVKPNFKSPGRATQSKDGLETPANVLPAFQSVSTASAKCTSKEVPSLEMSMSTIPEAQSNETLPVSMETESSPGSSQDKETATSPLNSTPDIHFLNRTLPDSVLESSGASDGKQSTIQVTPVEGADYQVKEASSMMPSEMGAPEHLAQDGLTSSAGSNQTSTSLSILPDTTSVPSDPDEPFFILSLMEVPTGEPSTQSPQTEMPVQQNIAVDSAVAAADDSLHDVPCGESSVAMNAVTKRLMPLTPPIGSEDTGTSAGTSSPKRKPKGFLSFLTHSSKAAEPSVSRRRKAATRRSNVSKSAPRKKTAVPAAPALPDTSRTSEEPCTTASQPLPSPSFSPDEVSICNDENSVEVQDEPTHVSTYFLNDIFTEVEDT